MKLWIARTLGGAVCTAAFVALGTGGAWASPHPSDGIDVGGVVKVDVGHHKKSSSSKHSSKHAVEVKVKTPVRAVPKVQAKAKVATGSGSPAVRARVGTSQSSGSHHDAAQQAAAKRAAEKKAAEKKAAEKKAAAAKAAKKKAASQKGVVARADAKVLPGVVPATRAQVGADVLSVPVRVCVEVNAAGCSRYVFSGHPVPNPGSENGGGGYATVLPSAVATAGAVLPAVGQADACVLVNAAGCAGGTGTGTGTGSGGTLPVVVGQAGTDLPAVGQVDACVLVNAPGCASGTGTGTGTAGGNGVLPPVVGTAGGTVPGAGTAQACVLVNAPGCTTAGAGDPAVGTDPGNGPGTDPADGSGNGSGNGSGDGSGKGSGQDVTAGAPAQTDVSALQGASGERWLAHTGAVAGTLGALALGLVLLSVGVVVLRRRARTQE